MYRLYSLIGSRLIAGSIVSLFNTSYIIVSRVSNGTVKRFRVSRFYSIDEDKYCTTRTIFSFLSTRVRICSTRVMSRVQKWVPCSTDSGKSKTTNRTATDFNHIVTDCPFLVSPRRNLFRMLSLNNISPIDSHTIFLTLIPLV